MSTSRRIIIGLLIVLFTSVIAVADWREGAKAIKISGGEQHTLVLTKNKFPWGCGPNGYGQLGNGKIGQGEKELTLVRVHGPGDVNYLKDINDIAAGWQHSIALDTNNNVWAWGDNYYGQLGDNKDSGPYSSTPVQVHGPNDVNYLENIIAIAVGRSGLHSLAIDANDFVWSWGLNSHGQLGDGSDSTRLTPVQVHGGGMGTAFLKNIIAVSAGEDFSMAIDANECVWTWGTNDYGQLGNGESGSDRTTPVQVLSGEQPNNPGTFLKNIAAISGGWDHSMALEKYDPNDPNSNGYVYTWGRNGISHEGYPGGRLGNGTFDDSSTPVIVLSGNQDPNDPSSYLKDIVAISAGDSHCLALDEYGNVWSWGDNSFGQLGNDTYDPCTTPVKVVCLDGEGYLENIVQIAAAYWHSIAVDANGTIWTWGKGRDGQLGLANYLNYSNTPHPINVVYNITQQTFYFAIQNAIDDAGNNDVIVASPGTYYENIVFDGNTITLRSTAPYNPDVVANTIIDGSNWGPEFDDWVLKLTEDVATFDNNSSSVLAGFTITNGQDGVDCFSSSPEIINCIVEGLSRYGTYIGNDSFATIIDCNIYNNSDYGVYLNVSDANIDHCIIQSNDDYGVYCYSSSWLNVTNCEIQNNGSGGISCYDSNLNIISCEIEDNNGNGIYIHNTNPLSIIIANNIIRGNDANGIYCERVWEEVSEVEIRNNWIHNNGSGNSGHGIFIDDAWKATVITRNNTIVKNAAYGISRTYEDDVKISSCIIWDNTTGQLQDCNATYSCIEDCNDVGDPNITHNTCNDPCFVDANSNDYHLGPNSPCIDAGDPCFVPDDPNETDIDGEHRIIDGNQDGNAIVDMGADEYNRIPQDPHKFRIKNNSDETVAWFGNLGNIVLKGTLTSGETIDAAPDNSFIIADSTADIVAYVDNEGNLCIEGAWSELCGSCNPTTDAFIIRDSSDANVSYIDFEYGDLCLTGGLYPNSDP